MYSIQSLLMLTLLLLMACGGGGGGDGGSQSNSQSSFTLSFSQPKASASCYIGSFCEARVRVNYHGVPPEDAIVIALIDSQEIILSSSIGASSAELTFYAMNLPGGRYQGVATIDVCQDQSCSKRYGVRYSLPYEIQILNLSPGFSTKPVGEAGEAFSTSRIIIQEFSGTNESYELFVTMPGVATEVIMPATFIEQYQVEKISANHFILIPPVWPANESYSFNFTGPGYNNSFDVNVLYDHKILRKEKPPLNYQVLAAETSTLRETSLRADSSLQGKYHANSNLLKSIHYIDGDGWARDTSSLWDLALTLTAPANYGIYEATVELSLEGESFSYPLVFAYSKTHKQSLASNRVTIKPSTASIPPGTFYHIWNNCLDGCEFEVYTPKVISNWLKNVNYLNSDERNNFYSYEIDLEKISEIDPSSGGVSAGIVALSNTAGTDNYSIAKIPVEINVPHVYYTIVKNAPANIPFEQTVHGFLYHFEGVEIVKLEQNANGDYSIEGDRFFHTVSREKEYVESITFEMPALTAGKYKLKFSGVFSKHYPDFLLQVE